MDHQAGREGLLQEGSFAVSTPCSARFRVDLADSEETRLELTHPRNHAELPHEKQPRMDLGLLPMMAGSSTGHAASIDWEPLALHGLIPGQALQTLYVQFLTTAGSRAAEDVHIRVCDAESSSA